MKRYFACIILAVCAFTTIGWGTNYEGKNTRNKGYAEADRKHQTDDEDIKRTQGDESGLIYIHDNKSHGDEQRSL